WWNDGNGGPPRWETFHLVELRQILERGYRAGHRRAVAGLSMGGLGAMYYAARSRLFTAAASFSGAVDPLRDPGSFSSLPPQAWGDPVAQRDIWIAHDPYYLAAGLRGVKNFIACGNGQPGPFDPPGTGFNSLEYSREQMSLALAGRLSELHIPVTTEFYGPGTHSWPYWQRDLHHAFPMLMSAIGAHPGGSA
ncbi:MAG: esterase family protein, partial [Actinobacteria bacterium]|nr:esterase family protein [Actinomycetota bacterium]